MNLTEDTTVDWYAEEIPDLQQALGSYSAGLSQAEAIAGLNRHGPNHLSERPPPPGWLIVMRQFQSPLIYVLALAALVSFVINETSDAAFIAVVLGLNAGQEGRIACDNIRKVIFLVGGALLAFLIHVTAMHLSVGQSVLGTGPLGLEEWGLLLALALTVFPAMKLHKWVWALRRRSQ